MGRPRKSPSMTDGKREIISRLIEEYDIKTAEDIQDALRDLLGGTIQGMMECEMEAQKEEHQASDPEYHDSRNGYKPKTLRSNYGSTLSTQLCKHSERIYKSHPSLQSKSSLPRIMLQLG